MKLVSVNLLGLSMVGISALTSVIANADQHTAPAPTVLIVNVDSDTRTFSVHQENLDQTASTPANNLKLTENSPPQDSVYYHVNQQDVTSVPAFNVVNINNYNLPVRDINDEALEELTIVDPATPVMPVNAFLERRDIPVQTIDPATHDARLTGSIRGLEVDIYQFVAQQGQTVNITYDQRNPAIAIALFHPLMGTRFGPVHVIPETGNYELRIVQTRQDAAKNKTPRYYDIGFSIK